MRIRPKSVTLERMNQVVLYQHPSYFEHDSGFGHPECAERLRAIDTGLHESGVSENIRTAVPKAAGAQDLYRVHDRHYVDRILSLRGKTEQLDGDTRVSPGSVDAALHAVGAVIEAVDAVLARSCDTAFCLVRPPGHHAEKDHAMGFCLFNNVAVAAAYALAEKGLKRVLIFDPDVHHGNGTQHLFYERPDVFYFSIHQWPFFPGTGSVEETGAGEGRGRNVNVPLPAGMGDPEYLYVTRKLLCPLIENYRPDLVVFSAGFDSHLLDPLGEMELSDEGFRGMYGEVLDTLGSLAIPFFFVLEGGYSLEALRSVVPRLIVDLVSGDRIQANPSRPQKIAVETVAEVLRRLESGVD